MDLKPRVCRQFSVAELRDTTKALAECLPFRTGISPRRGVEHKADTGREDCGPQLGLGSARRLLWCSECSGESVGLPLREAPIPEPSTPEAGLGSRVLKFISFTFSEFCIPKMALKENTGIG